MTLFVNEPDWNATLAQAASAYYKLILIVGPTGSGKSTVLKETSDYNFTHLNFGKAFSRELSTKPALFPSGAATTIDDFNERFATYLDSLVKGQHHGKVRLVLGSDDKAE